MPATIPGASGGGGPGFRFTGKLARFLANVGVWIGGISVVAMMLHVCADIFLREVLGIVVPGTLEIVSFFYMVACICLSFPVMQIMGEQVVVELFVQTFSDAAMRVLNLFATFLTLAYVGYLALAAAVGAWSATQDGEMQLVGDTDLYTWPSRWINFAGLAIMAVVVLWQLWAIYIREPETLPSNDPDYIKGEPS